MTRPLAKDGAPRLEIVEARDLHAAEVAEFIRLVWTPGATAESVLASRAAAAALNVAEPGVPPPTWIARLGGRVVGYVTSLPVRLWDGERDWPAYWIKGLMVLPEFRNGPIGHAVMKAAAARLPRSGGLAVAAPARRLFVALGYTDLGPIPNWMRPLAPDRMLRRLDLTALGMAGLPGWIGTGTRLVQATRLATPIGWAAGLALRVAAQALRLPAVGVREGSLAPDATVEELDALWETTRHAFPKGVVRDATYLRNRYPATPQGTYRWLAVRRRGKVAGVAILRRPRADGDPRLRGIQVATLVDLVYPPTDRSTGLALLGAVEREATRLGADGILATCSSSAVHSILRRQCYIPLAGNVHFLFRDKAEDGTRFRAELADWWLMRGDGQSDEVF